METAAWPQGRTEHRPASCATTPPQSTQRAASLGTQSDPAPRSGTGGLVSGATSHEPGAGCELCKEKRLYSAVLHAVLTLHYGVILQHVRHDLKHAGIISCHEQEKRWPNQATELQSKMVKGPKWSIIIRRHGTVSFLKGQQIGGEKDSTLWGVCHRSWF